MWPSGVWLFLALAIVFVSMLLISGVQIAYAFLTIAKCPDCGRIMQHVLYSGNMDSNQLIHQLECPFCQAKHIRPIQRGKKLTMYP